MFLYKKKRINKKNKRYDSNKKKWPYLIRWERQSKERLNWARNTTSFLSDNRLGSVLCRNKQRWAESNTLTNYTGYYTYFLTFPWSPQAWTNVSLSSVIWSDVSHLLMMISAIFYLPSHGLYFCCSFRENLEHFESWVQFMF